MEMGVSVNDDNDGDYYYCYYYHDHHRNDDHDHDVESGEESRCYNDICRMDNGPVVTRLGTGPSDLSL
jgi:hypothetical protein